MTENLFGWSDQTWLYLDHYGILLADIFTTLTVAMLIVGWLKRDRLRRWLTRNRFPVVGGEEPAERNWDGIVFTVSRSETPTWVIEQCRPAQVGLVVTRQSRDTADRIAARAGELGARVYGPLEISSPDDPAASRFAVGELLRRMAGQQPDAVLAVDLTGGKVPMSLGAFMAAEERLVETIYVSSDYTPGLKGPDMRTARIVRVSEPRRRR